jgi:pyruvate dehydrogenase E2 component (dihydrolipoamide acetyltransferase)
MAEIVMPRLSDTMEEGTILRWLKQEGEQVRRGEELVEIETDKANMTYESDQQGILSIIAAAGETLPVGTVIATVGVPAAGPAPDAREAPAATAGAGPGPSAGPPPITAAPPPERGPQAGPGRAGADGARVKASPLARRLAGESGVDLHGLAGSGPGGRIVKADVLGASSRSSSPPPGQAASAAAIEGVSTAKGETSVLELSRTQQTIARRMAESKATIPDFSLQLDVDMEACVELRSELKRVSEPRGAEGAAGLGTPTYNDMVVKASALALREHPRANGSYRDGSLQLHSRVNVGVAVAAEGALVVPTVFDADEKSLGEIARETRALAERVRSGAITPPELGGGTFTVSNLGMFGIRSFTAIINPPQAAILSVGSVEARAVVRDGELRARHTMTLTLVCDHRVLYGADAAELLGRVRELLEAPSALTL